MEARQNRSFSIVKLIIAIAIIATLASIIYISTELLSSIDGPEKRYLFLLTAISMITLIALAVYIFSTFTYKQNAEEIKSQREQLFLQEKMASLGQMIAGVAHEINTPLSYVSNNLQLINRCVRNLRSDIISPVETLRTKENKTLVDILKNQRVMISTVLDKKYPKKTDKAIELGNDAETGLKNISELVQNLKDFSRVDRQQLDYAFINEQIDLSLKMAERHIKKNHITIVKEYQENIPLLYCEPSKLNQVFLNSIVNACQAIIGGGVIRITTKHNEQDKNITVTFTDDGMGMTRKTKESIFDPFFTTKELGTGTGLGMSIVTSIIKEHNGKINISSKLGKGSTIEFELPFMPAKKTTK